MWQARIVPSCQVVSLGLIQACPWETLSQLEQEFPGFFIKMFSPDFPSNSHVISDSRLASVSLRLDRIRPKSLSSFRVDSRVLGG